MNIKNTKFDSNENLIPQDLVIVGRISDANGVRGKVKIFPHSKENTQLVKIKNWYLQKFDEDEHPITPIKPINVLQKTLIGSHIVASFEGITDRDQALLLKGYSILASRSEFPLPDSDEFYWVDLIGCFVYSNNSSEPSLIGIVKNLSESGAHTLLHIYQIHSEDDLSPRLNSKGRPIEILIPFVKDIVPVVDIKNKKILANWSME